MKYKIPGVGEIEIKDIILDLNGTLSVKGKIPDGVKERLKKLGKMGISVTLLTGDQRGTADRFCKQYGITFIRTINGREKEKAMEIFDKETTAAIGNARIDIGTFKHAKISIATLQAEGVHSEILQYIDVVVPSINDALDFFIDPDILAATMRK